MEKELLKPSTDVVFQALFGNNKNNITESLISDILGEKIEILDIRTDDTIMKEYPNDKVGRLDLKAKLKNGTICQIEMQMQDKGNTIQRILYYWAKTYSKQLKVGDFYKDLQKTIGIIITNYRLKELEEIENLNTKWQIMETTNCKKILTDDLELRIIEIPKAKKILEKEANNKIAQWLTFMANPNTKEAKKVMEENEEVKKARDVLYVMSEDEKLERLAELREKYIMDQKAIYAKGVDDGIEKGIEKNTKQTAKKLKEEGVDIQIIKKVTGLSIEEIGKM